MRLVAAFCRGLVKSLITTVVFFAVVEAGLRGVYAARNSMVRLVPLPYALGDEYGPVPPWLDRLMILVPDPALVWRNLPNVHRTYVDIFSPARSGPARTALLRRFTPTLPAEFRNNPTWTISLNSRGFRTGEFTDAKPQAIVRIACVGDSWTFGMNVDQDRTYPGRLAALLRERQGANVEVLNFGVLGYSSFQGLQLMKTRVIAVHPDIVAIGFGMNDSEVAGYRDKDMVGGAPPRLAARVKDVAEDLEFYKLLNYFVLTLKFHPKPVGEYLKEQATAKGSGKVDYEAIEPWTRVSPRDYEANLREMVRLVRASGARALLLDNELWADSPYRPVLRSISADLHVPLVDSLKIVTDAATTMANDLEKRLALVPPAQSAPAAPPASPADPGPSLLTPLVFRVSHGSIPVPGALSIVGTVAPLGDLAPNTVLMHDDGTNGDQRAGDGVWSFTANVASGTRLFYVYTNSGARGQWEGLDVPHIRTVVVPPSPDGRAVYLPIDTFGRVYMQADDWHTDAVGYDLIARAVADLVVGEVGRPAER